MQEALYSLLQMGKTSSKLAQLSERGIPFISVLTDPTMGGVSASLAMLGDLIIAEPGARIGFAGPRVIEQTVREKLPEGFQSSEFLLEHGAIDMIVDRREMREKLSSLLSMLTNVEAPLRPEPEPQPDEVVASGDDPGEVQQTDTAESGGDESMVNTADATQDGSEASQQLHESSQAQAQAETASSHDQTQSGGGATDDNDDKPG